MRPSLKQSLLDPHDDEMVDDRPKGIFRCCKKKKDNLTRSAGRTAFTDYGVGSTDKLPIWQTAVLADLMLNSHNGDDKWIRQNISFLQQNRGPSAESYLGWVKSYHQSKTRQKEMKEDITINDSPENTISETLVISTETIPEATASNIVNINFHEPLAQSEGTHRDRVETNFGERLRRATLKSLRSITSRDTESISGLRSKPTSALIEVEELNGLNMFVCLHKDSLQLDMGITGKSNVNKHLKDAEDAFEYLEEELSKDNTFFSKWILDSVLIMVTEFDRDSKSKSVVDPLGNLFSRIKTLASHISHAICRLVKEAQSFSQHRTVLSRVSSMQSEEHFVVAVVNHIFNRRFDSTRIVLDIDLPNFTFRIGEVFSEMVEEENKEFMDGFLICVDKFEVNLPPFFVLGEQTKGMLERMLSGEEKTPEYVVSITRTDPVIPENLDLADPYNEAVERLREVMVRRSPYEKLLELGNVVRALSLALYRWLVSVGFSVKLTLTSEELFPLVLMVVKRLREAALLPELLLCYGFLTEEMSGGVMGFYCNLFISAYHIIYSNQDTLL